MERKLKPPIQRKFSYSIPGRAIDVAFAIFCICLSIYYIYQISEIKVPIWDSAVYLVNAKDWLNHQPLLEGFRPPLLSWVIAAVETLNGSNFESLKYISAFFPLSSAVVLYWVVKNSKGKLFALGVVILTTLNEQVFSNNVQPLSEGISLFFLLLELYLLRSKNEKHWFLAGLALSLTFISRYPIALQAITLLLVEAIFSKNGKLVRNAIIGALPVITIVVLTIFMKTGAFQTALAQDSEVALLPSLFYLLNSINIWGPAFVFVPLALIFKRTYDDRNNYVFIVWFIVSLLFWSFNSSNFNYRFTVQFTPAVYFLALIGIQNILWYLKNGGGRPVFIFYSPPYQGPDLTSLITTKSKQILTQDGRLHVNVDGWIIRIIAVLILCSVIGYNLKISTMYLDPFIAYSTIIPIYILMVMIFGWFFYKNPTREQKNFSRDLLSVIIPVFNQRDMIGFVVESIYRSKYKNIEVIAIDDGSTDGSAQILDVLARRFSTLRIIHKRNEGKRMAISDGFFASKGKYLAFVDSDSVIHEEAFSEMMMVLDSHPLVGAAVGCVKVWNSDRNIITRCQDTWYDFAFNISKSAESFFNNVLCCTGCLAAYKRDVIIDFISKYWTTPNPKKYEQDLDTQKKASHKLKAVMANYDDSEDRALTAAVLTKYKVVYVASAIAYTDVPTTFRHWLKQQLRWQKGYLRASMFLSTFFWRKHPIMSFIFYTELCATLSTPLILFIVLYYAPFVLHNVNVTGAFITGIVVSGITQGLDYRLRDPTAKNWSYKILMNFLLAFVFSWLVLIALWHYRRNEWLTR